MDTVVPEIETPRLLLRPVSLDDAPQIQAKFPDPRIVAYLTPKVPWPT